MRLRVSSNNDPLLSGEPTKAHNKGADWESRRPRMHRVNHGNVSFSGRGERPLAQGGWWRNGHRSRTPSPPVLLLPPAWPSSRKRCWRVTQLLQALFRGYVHRRTTTRPTLLLRPVRPVPSGNSRG
jgi:hypothetical protein